MLYRLHSALIVALLLSSMFVFAIAFESADSKLNRGLNSASEETSGGRELETKAKPFACISNKMYHFSKNYISISKKLYFIIRIVLYRFPKNYIKIIILKIKPEYLTRFRIYLISLLKYNFLEINM